MSFARPYIIPEDDNEVVEGVENEFELVDYDSESSEPEITGVYVRETPSASSISSSSKKGRPTPSLKNGPIKLPDRDLDCYTLSRGCIIAPGDTVELKDVSSLAEDTNHSGDFLRIKHIIMNIQTDEVRLRGLRLRRTKYLHQMFDWKLNELAMVLRVDEDDERCPFVAGTEEVSIDRILRPRDCILTNKPYPLLSFRDGPRCAFPASLDIKEIKQQVFHGGRLVCRVVSIMIFKTKCAKAHSGVVRQLYARESDAPPVAGSAHGPGASRNDHIQVDEDEEEEEEEEEGFIMIGNDRSSQGKRRLGADSLEVTSRKRLSPMPSKKGQFVFGDVFCGAGGASQGAKQAGFFIKWGLDSDDEAIQAYQENHPGALPFRCNAHNFPPRGHTNKELRVDVLHLSPPCCYFSPAHTHEGRNDQANLEAIYTVGPILSKVKPRVATLEQTFGLSTREQHRANFQMLLHDMGKAGYDVRWKNQDLSKLGLVQQRKRLLIIAARRGTPLPPFPKPTHGPVGSGLKLFHYIKDALRPMERLAFRPMNDYYHQPKTAKEPREPYDPKTFLKGCITTSGGVTYHYTGTRRYTPRELSLLQSFPYGYKFTGGQGEATKQIGNAFPPIMAEALYRTIAKTLEAFDQGHIEAEDDLSDLDDLLQQKGVKLRGVPPAPRSSFDAPTRSAGLQSRYLVRDVARTGRASSSSRSQFAQGRAARHQQPRNMSNGDTQSMNLLDGLLDDFEIVEDDDVRETTEPGPRHRRPAQIITNTNHAVIEVSSSSESDDDSDTA